LERILVHAQRFTREKFLKENIILETATEFWIKNFFDLDSVEWDKFAPALFRFLHVKFCSEYHDEIVHKTKKCDISLSLDCTNRLDKPKECENGKMKEDVNKDTKCLYDCLYMLIMNITGGGNVKIEHWKKFCRWFDEPVPGMLNRLKEILFETASFFHGVMNWNVSLLLRGYGPGSFLIRLGEQDGIGGYILSFVDRRGYVREVHVRKKDNNFMLVYGNSVRIFESLISMIEFLTKQQVVIKPVPGPFTYLCRNKWEENMCETIMNEY